MLNTIPGLTRTNPSLPKQVLEARLKIIDKRRAELELLLRDAPTNSDTSARQQELRAEDAALAAMRYDIDAILNPRPPVEMHPELKRQYALQHERDKRLLRDAIKQQREQLEYSALREEEAGEYRQARLLRLLREAGEPDEVVKLAPWVNHDTRRTVRSNLSGLNVSDPVAEMCLGHGRKGLQRIYDQHRYLDQQYEAFEKWAGRLASIVGPAPTTSPQNVVRLHRA
jgi:hypothetical protein